MGNGLKAQLICSSILASTMVLAGCAGRYQAPLDDQSAVLDRGPAPIYSSGNRSSPSGVVVSGPTVVGQSGVAATGRSGVVESQPVVRATASAPSATSDSAAASTAAASVGAGVRVLPAPGVSIDTNAAQTAIQRGGIDRAPLGGQPPGTASPDPLEVPVIPLIPAAEAASTDYADEALIKPPAGQIQQQAHTPVPASHTVARGDTLYSISYQYSMDYRALAVANNLTEPYTIYPGQQLTLNIGNVSNNSLDRVPTIPPAPAGDTEGLASGRPAEAMESRRMVDVPVRVVDDISWQWPVDGEVLRGYQSDSTSISRGIDIGGKHGDPVYAAADGDVVYSGRGIQGQGNLIIIRHGARYLSAYSHNSTMLVSEGARIRAGDKIAEVGEDSRGTELLHFEVRVDGAPVDPSRYLPER